MGKPVSEHVCSVLTCASVNRMNKHRLKMCDSTCDHELVCSCECAHVC